MIDKDMSDNFYVVNENILTLESLLLPIMPSKKKEENKKKLSLYDFKKNNLNNLEEEILYYCLSPKSLLNFKSNLDNQKNYEFYNDIDSENFMVSQEERIDIILFLQLNLL